ncbi:hypothetical protein Bbelb_229880 [Branchiostoma belcheri]|nr:hypothetical protein Bbelb_229880 [Branchiostoma belcheri]
MGQRLGPSRPQRSVTWTLSTKNACAGSLATAGMTSSPTPRYAKKTGQPPVSHKIRQARLRLFGHLARAEPPLEAASLLRAATPAGWSRPRGRPRRRWGDQLNADLSTVGLDTATAWQSRRTELAGSQLGEARRSPEHAVLSWSPALLALVRSPRSATQPTWIADLGERTNKTVLQAKPDVLLVPDSFDSDTLRSDVRGLRN